jgi:hypothetical protein
MNEQLILTLLSGFIGAVGGSILTIFFTVWRDNKDERKKIAREKLEKVYGPLVALKKKSDEVNQGDCSVIRPSNPMEKELIEKIIFHYYHLIDDDLKEGIITLHPEISKNTMSVLKNVQLNVTEKIMKHYVENKKILGLK